MVIPAIHNVTLGNNITFHCDEFGSPPFSYQWFMRNSTTGDDVLLDSETGEFYTIPSTKYLDTGQYFCKVNNSLGILSNSTHADLYGKKLKGDLSTFTATHSKPTLDMHTHTCECTYMHTYIYDVISVTSLPLLLHSSAKYNRRSSDDACSVSWCNGEFQL